jgi:type IV pilus assembly protein PilM
MSMISGKHSSVGLDISDSSLKLAQLNKRGKNIRVQALSQLKLPAGVVDNGCIVDKKKLAERINKLWDSPFYGSIVSNRIRVSVPDSKSFVKLISIDNGLNDISEVIETEIEKHIPYMIDKVYYDWRVMEKGTDTSSVLIGACPQDISDSYYDSLSGLGFRVEALEMEAVTMVRALLKEENPFLKDKKESEGAYLIVDLGGSKTTFIIYFKNTIVFTTDIEVSGNNITEEIANESGMDEQKAEEEKKRHTEGSSKGSNRKIKKMINNNFKRINNKIREILDFYNNTYPESGPVNTILLVGGGANCKGIESFFDLDQVEVAIGDPMLHLSTKKKDILQSISKKKLKKDSLDPILGFSGAIGSALKEMFD